MMLASFSCLLYPARVSPSPCEGLETGRRRKFLIILLVILYGWHIDVTAQNTSTFVYTGVAQTYTVPVGVSVVTVDARGANGGHSDYLNYFGPVYNSRGGYGARVLCSLSVSPGQVLYVYVGGNGDSINWVLALGWGGGGTGAGGWNGGGSGFFVSGIGGTYGGGGGGGGTDIRTGGTAVGNRIMAAAGGGGAGVGCTTINYNRGGDGGGLTGENGYYCNVYNPTGCGGGGNQVTGGAGASYTTNPGMPGGLGTGGAGGGGGIMGVDGGGGGGGGYYGGGGGAGQGGGGGSSYADPTLTSSVTFTQGYNTTGEDTVFITNCSVGAVNGINVMCAGATTVFSDSSAGGVWSSSNTAVAIVGSSTGVVTGISPGTATVTYSVVAYCGATYSIATVTVNATPTTIAGIKTACAGLTTTLSDATTGGTWSSSNTTIATISAGGIVTGIATGTSIISYTNGSGCAAMTTVAVNPLPPIITGTTVTCTGSTTSLSDPGGGTWSSSATTVATITGTGVVTGIVTGTTTITYSLPTGCIATTIVTINPKPSVVTGATKVCAAASITLSDSVSGGTWSAAGGAASVNPVTGVVTGIASGVAIITYATGAGCMVTKAVSVNPAPPPITGPALGGMCAGGTKLYVYDADTTYGSWTSTFITVTTGGLVSAYNAGVGTITYTLPTGCFTTAPITVNPLPDIITGVNSVCMGSTTMLSDTTAGGAWTPGYGSIAVVSGVGIVSGISAGTAIVTYTLPVTGCFVTDTITVYTTPAAITGTATGICAGATTALSDATSGGAWSSTSGIATVSGTGVVTGVAAGTAIISYTIGALCASTKMVTVYALPNVYGVTGGGSYCAGGAGEHVGLSGSDIGVKYKLYNGGAVIDSLTGTGGVLDFGTETLTGTYTITAANTATTCNNGMSGSATVIVNPVLVPSVSISQTPGDTVCTGTAIAFTAMPVNGGTPVYQWKVNGVNTGIGGTYSYTPVNGDAVIVLMTSNAPCASPVLADTFVNVPVFTPTTPIFTITETQGLSIEEGQAVTFTATVTNGATDISYQWLLNGASLPGQTAGTYTSSTLANYDKVGCKVTSSISECSASASEVVEMAVLDNGEGIKPLIHRGGGPAIWPNPVKDELTISNAANSELRIYNLLGQQVPFEILRVTNNAAVLHVGDLVPGVYVVHIIGSDGAVVNVRLVKE